MRGRKGDIHIVAIWSVVQYVGKEVIRGTRVTGRVAGGDVTREEAMQTCKGACTGAGARKGRDKWVRGRRRKVCKKQR